MNAYRRLLVVVLVALAWALGPVFDRAIGLTWAVGGAAVLVQAVILGLAGVLAFHLGKPSLRGSSWGMLAVGAVGAGLNRWWVAQAGGAVLLGPAAAQVAHAAVVVGLGVLIAWGFRRGPLGRRRRRSTAEEAAERLSERAPS